VTLLSFLIKASVSALKQHWEVNSSIHPDGDKLIRKNYYNIGFAADTPHGLMVPVIKGADSKGIVEISKELGELSKKARDGALKSADMQGASFTISSLGGIGGTSFTPIVNAPEVAILGVTRSKMAPVWDGEAVRPAQHAAALAVLRPPRHRRGAGRALLRHAETPARRRAPADAVRGRAMAEIEVKVPDIGDFTDVPVIAVLVKEGDTVAPEDPLIELESDKATMEVPAPAAGKVTA
jgi:pyruvate/2-oxoglutarate dehydrogenase complex dihydrolipoamide acyltransferase (E2) component